MPRHSAEPPSGAASLKGNRFHRCTHQWPEVLAAAEALKRLIDEAPPQGLTERALLAWFGASTARISMLAHAWGEVDPTHVARELIIGDMRADFALLSVPEHEAVPRLLLVECQGARDRTLFERGSRQLLYWGRDFLDGFSQIVDWHFTEHHSLHHQGISSLVGDLRPMDVSFLLVAGLRRFVKDPLSQRRLAWWTRNVRIASHFRIKQFDDVAIEAGQCARRALVRASMPPDLPAMDPLALGRAA